MSEYVRIEFHCYIFVSMTNLACGGTGLISVFCCIWIANPAWCGLRLLLFLYSEMRLGSLGTVQSFLSRGN